MAQQVYIAIDLKSFYASVECVERGLDPLTTNLVVADASRTEKTICLAVSPALKAIGVPGRPRLFEAVEQVNLVNARRLQNSHLRRFAGSSTDARALAADPQLAIDFITAPPRMAHYIAWSTKVYSVYLKYIAPEDVHVYSIDEVFINAAPYLPRLGISAHDLTMRILRDVLATTGITATAGIGTNLYLAKIAMDIVAKHLPADSDGVRIAALDERAYREQLWSHRPLTDFWRVGRGIAQKLESHGLYTMGDVARCSIGQDDSFYNERLLYRLFGVNAELLIDHAWGWEPCTMADIKAYKPRTNSLGSGQVLQEAYSAVKARLVTREMTDALVLQLVEHGLVCDQIVLTVGYDWESLLPTGGAFAYTGPVTQDAYGRKIPKHAHGTVNFPEPTASAQTILPAVTDLFDRIVDSRLLIRRINLSANHVVSEDAAVRPAPLQQLDLFVDDRAQRAQQAAEAAARRREKQKQLAILSIKKKYGKNAILKGMDFAEGATTRDRNDQIGGHKA